MLGRQCLTLLHRTILLLSANHDPLTYRPNINNSGSIFLFSLGNPTRPQYRIATAAAAASQDAFNHRLSVVSTGTLKKTLETNSLLNCYCFRGSPRCSLLAFRTILMLSLHWSNLCLQFKETALCNTHIALILQKMHYSGLCGYRCSEMIVQKLK